MITYFDLRPFSRQPFRTPLQQELLWRILATDNNDQLNIFYVMDFEENCFAIPHIEAAGFVEKIISMGSGHSSECNFSKSKFNEHFPKIQKSQFDFEVLKYEESEWVVPELSSDFDLYVSWREISKHVSVKVVVSDLSKLTKNLPVGQDSSVEWSRIFRWVVQQKKIIFTSPNAQSEFIQLLGVPEDEIPQKLTLI